MITLSAMGLQIWHQYMQVLHQHQIVKSGDQGGPKGVCNRFTVAMVKSGTLRQCPLAPINNAGLPMTSRPPSFLLATGAYKSSHIVIFYLATWCQSLHMVSY